MEVQGLILLDRDGVLNRMVVDQEHGLIDSPLNPEQVQVFPWAAACLKKMNEAGFTICVITNQPAAAKRKTTLQNLKEVHEKVVTLVGSEGGKIFSSQICFHRAEDDCECRKPKTGLLEKAHSLLPGIPKNSTWVVGDGLTDVQAGKNYGVKTAFLGPRKADMMALFHENNLRPDFWGTHLGDFTTFLLSSTTKQGNL